LFVLQGSSRRLAAQTIAAALMVLRGDANAGAATDGRAAGAAVANIIKKMQQPGSLH
jgi:hypothetical protein